MNRIIAEIFLDEQDTNEIIEIYNDQQISKNFSASVKSQYIIGDKYIQVSLGEAEKKRERHVVVASGAA